MTDIATATTWAATWEDAEEILLAQAGPNAYPLPELTALHDRDLHEIRLDPDNRCIWWAWDRSFLDETGWTVERLTPDQAREQAADVLYLIQEREQNPHLWEGTTNTSRQDQDALGECAEIIRLGLSADPEWASLEIQRARQLLRQEDALLQRAYEALKNTAGRGNQ